MKTEIVKYHNDLNKIIFPNFYEQDLNIFNNVIQRVFDRGDEVIEFSAEEVAKFFGSSYDKKMLAWLLHGMSDRMTKMGFKFISEKENKSRMVSFAIFPTFEVKADINERYTSEYDKYTLTGLKVRVNTDFLYLFNELIGKYTKYELLEFIDIKSGKFAKRLYMTLKQYRDTGKCLTYKNSWDDFLAIHNISKNLKMCDIDKELKKAIAELTKERNLFDQRRIPFQNLKYEKIKGSGRGQGGKVIGIIFTFDPEPKQDKAIEAKLESKQTYTEQDKEALQERLNTYIGASVYFNQSNWTIEALYAKLSNDELSMSIAMSIRDEDQKPSSKVFDTEQDFLDWYNRLKR